MRQHRLGRFLHRALGQHDIIVPQAKRLLHLLEQLENAVLNRMPTRLGHFQRVTKRLPGDAKFMRIDGVLSENKLVRPIRKHVKLLVERRRKQRVDLIVLLIHLLAHAPPCAELGQRVAG